jgi:hypothetical protein
LLNQCRLAERRGLLTGHRLNEVQVFALEVLMYDEWLTKQNATPLVQQVRKAYRDGHFDQTEETDSGEGLEDLSAVQWQSPSDFGEEGVMNDIEAFNKAMAENLHVVVDDQGGEWL